jgi:hypothetical protein
VARAQHLATEGPRMNGQYISQFSESDEQNLKRADAAELERNSAGPWASEILNAPGTISFQAGYRFLRNLSFV